LSQKAETDFFGKKSSLCKSKNKEKKKKKKKKGKTCAIVKKIVCVQRV
jgi:hypothetical protein